MNYNECFLSTLQGVALAQGLENKGAQVAGRKGQGRHGRRRNQRLASASRGRRWHRHRHRD